MARQGISFEQVVTAADALIESGSRPTTRSIRSALGTGSPNTIHRLLKRWRDERTDAPNARAYELPAELGQCVQAAIARAVSEAVADLESRLAEAEKEADDLADAGQTLETENQALRDEARTITSELDTLRGRVVQQDAVLARLQLSLEHERTEAETARVRAAQASQNVERLEAALAERTAEAERQNAALTEQREARVAADSAAAVATALRSAAEERLKEMQHREQLGAREMADLRGRIDDLHERERAAAADFNRREGELRLEVARLKSEVESASSNCANAVERARLQWQLAAAQRDPSTGSVDGPAGQEPNDSSA